MTLSYETCLEDFVEPYLRHRVQSGMAGKGKLRFTVGGVLLGVSAALLGLNTRGYAVALTGALVGAVAFGLLFFLVYDPYLRRRVRKYFVKETAGTLPTITVYRIEDGRISCERLAVAVTYRLSDLEEVTEAAGFLEISFGKTGFCTIPLRAFESDEQKAAFVALLKRPEAGPEA